MRRVGDPAYNGTVGRVTPRGVFCRTRNKKGVRYAQWRGKLRAIVSVAVFRLMHEERNRSCRTLRVVVVWLSQWRR
jgi:hypothetical protein